MVALAFERVSGLPLNMYRLRHRLGLERGLAHKDNNTLSKEATTPSAFFNKIHTFLEAAHQRELCMRASYDPAKPEVGFSITGGLLAEDTGFFEGVGLIEDVSSIMLTLGFNALRSDAFSIAIQGGMFALSVSGENPFSLTATLDSVALRPGPDAPKGSAFKPLNIALVFDTPILVSEFSKNDGKEDGKEGSLYPLRQLMSTMAIRPHAMILGGGENPVELQTAFLWSTHITPARNAVAAYLAKLGLTKNPAARPRGLSRFITEVFERPATDGSNRFVFRQMLAHQQITQLIELD